MEFIKENLSTILIVAVIAVIIIYSVISYRKKLSSGCCGSGGEIKEKKIKPSDKNKNNYTYSALIKINKMTCEHCVRRIENALNSLDGVWAKADLSDSTVKVLFKREECELMCVNAITKAGYNVSKIEIDKKS